MRIRPSGEFEEDDERAYKPAEARERVRTDEASFAVPAHVIVLKFGFAAVLGVFGLLAANRPQVMVALTAAVAVAIYAARDLVARVRLRADRDGVVAVSGYAGRRRLAWSEIERVRVDARSRLGASSQLLEIDADPEIFVFSRYDLGVDPAEAAEALEAVRQAWPR